MPRVYASKILRKFYSYFYLCAIWCKKRSGELEHFVDIMDLLIFL